MTALMVWLAALWIGHKISSAADTVAKALRDQGRKEWSSRNGQD